VRVRAVLDANIVAALFREALGHSSTVSGSPTGLFESLSGPCVEIVTDTAGQIEHEWEKCVEKEWYEAFYLNLASTTNLYAIPADACLALLRKLKTSAGFPPSADKHYVRTAFTAAKDGSEVVLVTEDIDFFDPKAKTKPGRRAELLAGKVRGPVQKLLKSEVRCFRLFATDRV
jgi:hypothetical protein